MRPTFPMTRPPLVTVASLALSACLFGQATCGEHWSTNISPHGGPNTPIHAAAVWDLGSGPELFVMGGGFLNRIGELPVHYIAKFDGTTWSPIGIDDGFALSLKWPRAMTVFDDGNGPRLYVAGEWALPGIPPWQRLICRWEGSSWTIVGTPGNVVTTMTVFDDGTGPALIVGGWFSTMNAVAANRIARWNGNSWSAMGPLYLGNAIPPTDFAVFDSGAGPTLYVGRYAGTAPGAALQRWDGPTNSWITAGHPGLTSVSRLCTHADATGSGLFVIGTIAAGTFGAGSTDFVKWDGATWTPIADVCGGAGILSFDDGSGPALYVSLPCTGVIPHGQPPITAWGIARYANGSWSTLPGSSGPLNAMNLVSFPIGGVARLVAIGEFGRAANGTEYTDAYDTCPPFIAQWNGSQWTGLGSGSWYRKQTTTWPEVQHRASALAVFDDGSGSKLYAGGEFHRIGDVVANGFARWTGSTWEGIGAPAPFRRITCMTVFDDGSGPALYLATTGNGQAWIYRWNGGTSFTQLGPALTPYDVTTMTTWDDGTGAKLWIGFSYERAPVLPQLMPAHPPLRRWNGTQWQALADFAGIPNPNGSVFKLLVDGQGRLVVAGKLNQVGGSPAMNITRISPFYAFDPLGAGIPTPNGVIDVAAYDDGAGKKLWALARGAFTPPNQNTIPPPPTTLTVNRFDGTSWSVVRTIAGAWEGILRVVPFVGDEDLYVAASGVPLVGTAQGPLPPFSVDRFNGFFWTSIPVDSQVEDVAIHSDGSTFFAGGFDTIAGTSSGGIARLTPDWPTIVAHPEDQTVVYGHPIELSISAAGPPTISYEWFDANSVPLGVNAPTLTIPAASFSHDGAYFATAVNACGQAQSRLGHVVVRGCELSMSHPFGPGILAIAHASGPPGGHAFTAISFDQQNATSPGTGSIFGLHLAAEDAIFQFILQGPPFVTTLSASGTAFWAGGPIPPALVGTHLWGLSVVYDPATLQVFGAPSELAHVVLQ